MGMACRSGQPLVRVDHRWRVSKASCAQFVGNGVSLWTVQWPNAIKYIRAANDHTRAPKRSVHTRRAGNSLRSTRRMAVAVMLVWKSSASRRTVANSIGAAALSVLMPCYAAGRSGPLDRCAHV